MNFAYIRVSSISQNEARQMEAMKNFEIDKFFIDKATGKNRNREHLNKMIEQIRKGDKVYCLNIKRLGRSLLDLMSISKEIQAAGAELIFIEDNIDTSTISGKLYFQIMGAIAEANGAWITERAAQGRAAAKLRGETGGRPKGADAQKKKRTIILHRTNTMSAKEICDEVGISRSTYYRYIKN